MTLEEMQRRIIANREKRNWPSATDLSKTTLGLVEKVGEFEKARRTNSVDRPNKMLKELGDIMIFALGGIEIIGGNAQSLLERLVIENENRTGQTDH